uniref:Uncharacterized protein n=1 Tax=Meloidogyne hapla TaxID=6305 RepID=A0A1I8B1Z9_MELHA
MNASASLFSTPVAVGANIIQTSSQQILAPLSSSSSQQHQTTTINNLNSSKNIIRSSTQSPPNASAKTIPRLSTAGVSPLRPVPSLIGQQPTDNINENQTNNVKKRQRNFSSSSPNNRPKKVQKQQGKSKIEGAINNNNCAQTSTTIEKSTNEIRANSSAGGQQKSPAEGKSPQILIEVRNTQTVPQQLPQTQVVNTSDATSKSKTPPTTTTTKNNKNTSENKTKTRTYNRSKPSKKQQNQQLQAAPATQPQQFQLAQHQVFTNSNINNISATFQNQFAAAFAAAAANAAVATAAANTQQQQQSNYMNLMQNLYQQQNRQQNQQQTPQTFEQQQFASFAANMFGQQQQQLSPQQIRAMQQMFGAMGMFANVNGIPFSSEQNPQHSFQMPTTATKQNGTSPTKTKRIITTTTMPSAKTFQQKLNSSNGIISNSKQQQIVPLNASSQSTIFGENSSNQLTNNLKKASTISS